MRRNRLQTGPALAVLAATLAAITGCPPPPPPLPPVTDDVPMQTVIDRVNRNIRAMDFLLRAGGVSASGKAVRASGKTESFDANGTLFVRRPHNLYMELKHSLAGKIEMGSNPREFWYWERFDKPRYFTGRWDSMSKPWETDVPLRPDQFLDMLALREIPERTEGPAGPTFAVNEDHYALGFFDRKPGGRMYQARNLAISRRPPFLVTAITYYNPDGRAWMTAELSDYRAVEGTAVLLPHRIQVRSLRDQSRMTLEFSNMKPSDNPVVEQQRIARSPLERQEDVGEVIRLDRPLLEPAAPAPAATTSNRSEP